MAAWREQVISRVCAGLYRPYKTAYNPTFSALRIGSRRIDPSVATIVPFRGSGSATSSRALAAYQIDFEGKYNLVPSGATREQGARYVRNLLTYTEDFSNAAWTKTKGGTGVVPVLTSGQTDPNGGSTAWRLQMDAGDGTAANYSLLRWTVAYAGTLRNTMWFKSNTGASQTALFRQGDAAGYITTVTATTSWQRIDNGVHDIVGNNRFDVVIGGGLGGDNTLDLLIWHPMSEDVTGQTNQNPSEYVSVGVESAPFHGANVDGVKYFSTLNGNTVASNVVTEATGVAINSSEAACAGGVTAKVVDASGPVGLLTEAAATNKALQSLTFQTTWVPNNTTVVANQAVAPDGTTTADLMHPTTTGIFRSINTTPNSTAIAYTWGVYAKKAGLNHLMLFSPNATLACWFNLDTGVVGTNSSGMVASITALQNGWYRATLSGTNQVGQQFYIGLSDADNSSTATTSGTNGIYLWEAFSVPGSIISSPVTTTTAEVTRPADIAQYVSAGNLSATAMTIKDEITPSTELGTTEVFSFGTYVDVDNYTGILHTNNLLTARKRISGSNHDATVAITRTVGTTIKYAARFDGNGIQIAADGVLGTADATGTASQIGTNFQIGGNGNGAAQDYCAHRNNDIFLSKRTDAYGVNSTSASNKWRLSA